MTLTIHPSECGPCADCQEAIDRIAQGIAADEDARILREFNLNPVMDFVTKSSDAYAVADRIIAAGENKFGTSFAPECKIFLGGEQIGTATDVTIINHEPRLLYLTTTTGLSVFDAFVREAERAGHAFVREAERAGHAFVTLATAFIVKGYARRARDRRRQVRRYNRTIAMMEMPAYDWYLRISGRAHKHRAVTPPELRSGGAL
jgi:hypothetical protein